MSRVDCLRIDGQHHPRAQTLEEDRRLATQLIAGEGSAWQTFIVQYGRLIRARAADVAASFGRSHDESAIDDSTAEVFAALLHNNAAALKAYAGRSSLATYVAVIATRSATRQFAARRSRAESTDFPDAAPESRQSEADPERHIEKQELLALVRDKLHLLSEKQRRIVELYHLEDQSYLQVSEAMGIPIGSVGVTLKRAEAKLRELLCEE